MEDVNDADLKRERPTSYGHAPPPAPHRMPPSETPALHEYPLPPPGPGMPHPWNPPHASYEAGDRRPPPPAQPPYPPHNYPPPPGQEPPPRYPPEHAYSRPGSVSAPSRSPADAPPQYHAVNGNGPEGPYYPPHSSQEYRPPSHSYGPPPETPNGTQQQSGLHLVTSAEMMSGQPPGPPSSQYGPPSAGPPPTPYQYYTDAYGPQGHRRKPVRAAQACDSCRQRKAKCDEGRPECLHCKDNNLKCTYREVPPQKQEKQVLAINEKLEGLERQMAEDSARSEQIYRSLEEKITRTNDLLQNLLPNPQATKREVSASSAVKFKRETSQPTATSSNKQNLSSATQELLDRPYLPPTGGAEFALPPKHTTAAQNLLRWPSIKALIPDDHRDDYVMDLESRRGLLRLYGCGEGDDPNDGKDGTLRIGGAPSPSNSSSSSGHIDDDCSTPSPGGVWGSGQIPLPSPGQNSGGREHPGGVSPHGGLILESDTVDRYFKSYMETMHVMHPFLESKVIRKMVTVFKMRYSWDYRLTQKIPATIGKRKREAADSPNSGYDIPAVHRHHPRHPGPANIEHSIANAIVLLVIALGKICSHKTPLPGAPSPSAMPTSTPQNAYSDLPVSVSAPSSPYHHGSSRNGAPPMAVSGPGNPQGKNMDVIPGLAYFAKAADILGELPGGVDTSHVQANLLAGLYMGQLARVFASHYYISNACKACMVLIETKEYKQRELDPLARNLITFAFWSCLQLESDILAELELPPSGVTRYEGAMHAEMPTGITLDLHEQHDPTKQALRYYSHQIQLRRTLNEVHTALYKEDPAPSKPPGLALMKTLNENLEGWRACLQEWNWDDDAHMSRDVNVARMRGKYYGAKYIIFRVALYHVLSYSTAASNRLSESPNAQGFHAHLQSPVADNMQGVQRTGTAGSDMAPPWRQPLDPRYLEAAETCVAAAIRSTTAFDGVEGRLIVTNIFGTAHAQFGNVVILAAVYTSTNPDVKRMVPEKTMVELLDRTIIFLKRSEDISPVLKHDAFILETIKGKLFPYGPSSSVGSFSAR